MLKFFKKKREEPKNFREILAFLKKLEKNIDNLSQDLEALKHSNRFSLKKVGMIRFNPFSDVGGDQSFSIALLDDNNDGLVITSLYTREGNRIFGKPIKNGGSKYPLSQEEKGAIKKAIG